jgi:hypothetical protein
MKTNKLTFVGQIRKGNMIITTYVDANKNEFRFAKLVKRVSNVTKLEEVRAIKETKTVAVIEQAVGAEQISSIKVQEIKQEEVVEIIPINKPSDRFNIDCYTEYVEYVSTKGKAFGKVPSMQDYFEALAYFKARNEKPIWR